MPKQTSLELQPTTTDDSENVDLEAVTDPDDTIEHSRQNSGRWHRKGLRRRPPTPPTSTTSEVRYVTYRIFEIHI